MMVSVFVKVNLYWWCGEVFECVFYDVMLVEFEFVGYGGLIMEGIVVCV